MADRRRRRLLINGGVPLPSPVPDVNAVFDSSLWTGSGIAQDIHNGVDLTQGGMIWTKNRDSTEIHKIYDTARGPNTYLPISTGSAQGLSDSINSYNSDGFSLGAATGVNTSPLLYVGWTFRKAPRFFDVITWTGNGAAFRAIPHALGVTPGMIIVKRRDSAGSPAVNHIANNPGHQYNLLNDTALPTVNDITFGGQPADASNFYLGSNAIVNASGGSFVAWLFAHDPNPGSVIQCGKYTGNGSLSGPTINVGFQPQFILIRRISGGTGNWVIFDTARGIATGTGDLAINPNLPNAEVASDTLDLNASGFTLTSTSVTVNAAASDYEYVVVKA